MVTELPQSILFCCDHNAVRSPMAEGIMKKFYGLGTSVQSVGVYNDLEIDGFAISVCDEIQVELSRHKSRSFDEMAALGDDLSSFDLVVAHCFLFLLKVHLFLFLKSLTLLLLI